MQRIVAGAWRTVLGLDETEIDLNANFFALGGHSLLIVRVLALIQESASVELPIRQFFENPTVLGVAAALSQAQIETAEPDVVEELLRHVQAAVTEPSPSAADRVNPPSAACGKRRDPHDRHPNVRSCAGPEARAGQLSGQCPAAWPKAERSGHGQLGRGGYRGGVWKCSASWPGWWRPTNWR